MARTRVRAAVAGNDKDRDVAEGGYQSLSARRGRKYRARLAEEFRRKKCDVNAKP